MNCSLNKLLTLMLLAAPLSFPYSQALAADSPELPSVSKRPLFLTESVSAMVMLVMGKDHTLFTEAYNDLTDLNGKDGLEASETRFTPSREYYGYFDPYKCYSYDKNQFTPSNFISGSLADTECGGKWSGNFLNYVTTSRIDALRKALYGGYRQDDPKASGAVLEASYVPADAHAWAKSYDPFDPKQDATFKISNFAPYSDSDKLFFARINTTATSIPAIRVLNLTKVKSKKWLKDADYEAMRPWQWAGSGTPVARTQLILPKGEIYQIKEACTGPWGNCKPNDFPNVTGGPDTYPADTLQELSVRVQVCADDQLRLQDKHNTESCIPYRVESKGKATITYKPAGILQAYAGTSQAEFGLITGSNSNNLQGGVLRRNVANFNSEVEADGRFSALKGIVNSLNSLKIDKFKSTSLINVGADGSRDPSWLYHSGYFYEECDERSTFSNGRCQNWGNPIGEMLSESLRYFYNRDAGPTEDFADSALSTEAWVDPYTTDAKKIKDLSISGKPRPYCTPAFNLLISNTSVSNDADQVQTAGTLGSWTTFADTIGNKEGLEGKSFFFGQYADKDTDKGIPNAKTLSTLSNVRGTTTEPTKEASYSSAGLAYAANTTNIFSGKKKPSTVKTMAVALAEPLPDIKIKVGAEDVTLVPFAKSVRKWDKGGAWQKDGQKNPIATEVKDGGIDPNGVTPTSTVIDFYVEEITPTSGRFTINYADNEQGGDYDSDMVATYSYSVAGDKLTIELTSESASGDIEQHAGYVLSGVSKEDDRLYLDIRDVPDCREDNKSIWGREGNTEFKFDTNQWGTISPNSKPMIPFYNINPTKKAECDQIQGKTQGGFTTSRTFTVKGDATAAGFLKSPLWYAARWGSYNSKPSATAGATRLVPDDVGKMESASGYFPVTNPANLVSNLNEALGGLPSPWYSLSAYTVSDYILTDNSLIFSAQLRENVWQGDLLARKLKSDGSLANAPEIAQWSASLQLSLVAHSSRNIYTGKTPFTADTLTAAQLQRLAENAGGGDLTSDNKTAYGKNLVNYLRGDDTYEKTAEPTSGITLRNRGTFDVNVNGTVKSAHSVLGDIVYSTPVYAKSGKGDPFVIVGANDGMAHIFDATSGNELYAYVPTPLLDGTGTNLGAYTHPGYQHESYVDGNISVKKMGDTTLAVGAMGFGARAIYALDVSDIKSLGSSTYQWEFTDKAMGYSRAAPALVKVKKDSSNVVIISNGYNAPAENGVNPKGTLFVLKASDGTKIKSLVTTEQSGLSEAAAVDSDGDGYTDLVYAGDLKGNLWKFDLSSTDESKWSTSKLFSSGQPITTRPTVGPHDNGGTMVYFGTGKYLEVGDNTLSTTQAVYGIWDKPGSSSTVTLDKLEKRTLKDDPVAHSREIVEKNSIDWTQKLGWYFELPALERVIANPQLVLGKLNVVTMIPTGSTEECELGGKGWLMQINGKAGQPWFDNTDQERKDSNIELGAIHSELNGYVATKDKTLKSGAATQGHTREKRNIENPSAPIGVGSWKQLY